ncbi:MULTISPECIES: CHAT domain-containing protein [Moorena]|nr:MULTISPECIES: CHAT domain-containing protein [Moorena]OLT66269.1 hypothetical protein BI334_15695 [Moorena producens 3L]
MADNTFHAQLDFLFQVLQATADSNGDEQVVYPLLAKNTDKINDILKKFRVLVTTRLAEAKADEPEYIAVDIFKFSTLILQFTLGDKASNMEIGITGYEVALTVFTREAWPQDWALTQYNLGNAYFYRITGQKEQNLEEAIACYQLAKDVYTREAFPEKWAMTQNNLGEAYRNRITGDKAQNLEEAIACYQLVKDVYTREAFPEKWAMTQTNLGNAYSKRITGQKAQNQEQAIACYQLALEVRTREAFPEKWAMTQNSLGNAYSKRITGQKAQNQEQAIACYQLALEVRTREAFPEKWAMTQNSLGNAYLERITGQKEQNIERAIVCYQLALEVRTRQAFPEKWAMTQYNLGNAYSNRITGQKAQNQEQAIAYYQLALEVRTREAFPVYWAMTQHNLGNAYSNRITGQKAQNLEQAIAYYQLVLEVHTREAFPVYWAMTQNNLGSAYSDRITGQKAQNLEDAIACYQSALAVRTREAFPYEWASTQYNLGRAYQDAQKFPEAYNAFDSVIKTVEFLRDEIISGSGEEEYKTKLAEKNNRSYRGMVETCLDLTNITAAIDYVERSKTRNLVEKILSRDLKTIFPVDVATQLQQYRDEIAAGQEQIQQGKADNPKVLAQHIQQLRQQRNDLQDHNLPIGSRFKFEQFQQKLDHNTAIVEFYITGDKLLTFIFSGQTQKPIVWQSEPQDFKKLVNWTNKYLRDYKAYRINKDNYNWQNDREHANLANPCLKVTRRLGFQSIIESVMRKNGMLPNDLSNRLHELADILSIDHIIQQIPEKCDRLILIPHRFLHLFPLHALPITSKQREGNPKILMDRFPAGVSYAPSCQLLQLVQTRKRPEEFTHLFAVQNSADNLHYTPIEVDVVKGYFNPPPDTEILVENAATKAAIDSKAFNSYHCLHFSCHGYFNYQEPRKSALILANAHKSTSAEPNSERYLRISEEEVFDLEKCLTIDQVFDLQLKQCRLVTLSACETGLIDYTNISDEYIGLPSGFLVAGSPAVVSSLWKVNDLSTALLMIKFYDNLLNSQMSLAVALNQAQLWLRDVTKENLLLWIESLSIKSYQKRRLSAPLLKNDDFKYLRPSDKPFEKPYHWAAFCAIGQ